MRSRRCASTSSVPCGSRADRRPARMSRTRRARACRARTASSSSRRCSRPWRSIRSSSRSGSSRTSSCSAARAGCWRRPISCSSNDSGACRMSNITRRTLLASLGASLALPRIASAAATAPGFATLAPRGSVYHRALQEVGEAWRRAANAPTGFRVYPGGIEGDELDIVRKMRIGQLDGGMISVIGLSAIEPGASALQYMPLVFRSWEEVDAVSRRLRPLLEQRIAERGFVVLYWGEAGWVRFFTKAAAVRPRDFQPLKLFAWSGTPQQVELMRSLGYQPVSLETNDILPGLQTGLIDAVPTIASWALAAQIDHVAPHMLDMRW